MQHPDPLRLQAYFDSEVDAVSAADIERHAEHCVECRVLLEDLEQSRAALRRELRYERAPPVLRARVMRTLDQEGAINTARPKRWVRTIWRARSFWVGAGSGVGITAVAAALAIFLLAPPLTNPLIDDLLNAHVRSLMPTHLIDVVSTDKHAVKPWFAGHTDVSPVVADFEQQGYRLVGGRADYLEHQRSAVVVYQHGAHVINVFSWAANKGSLPNNATHNGYHFAFWKSGDLAYCAVSDTSWDELLALARLLRDLGARDGLE